MAELCWLCNYLTYLSCQRRRQLRYLEAEANCYEPVIYLVVFTRVPCRSAPEISLVITSVLAMLEKLVISFKVGPWKMVCYHLPTWLIDNACISGGEARRPVIPLDETEWHHDSKQYGRSGHLTCKPSCNPCALLQPREQCIPQRFRLPFSSHWFQ
jgi:hypothetical protein